MMVEDSDDSPGGLRSPSARIAGLMAVLVVAVVAARARAAGIAPPLAPAPSGLVAEVLRTVGVGVVVAGVILLIWGRQFMLRRLVRRASPKELDKKRRRLLLAIFIGTVFGLLAVVFRQFLAPTAQQQLPQQQADTPDDPSQGHGMGGVAHAHHPGQAGIGSYITLFLLLAVLAVLVVALLRKRGETEPDDEGEELDTVAEAMDAGQEAVRDPKILDPREAIVACFAAMERALSGFGRDVTPQDADTPEEVLRRGITGCQIPEPPARTLLELFREARFSTHPMGQDDRENADHALAEMRASLATAPR